jgi:hypothetical protein
VQVLTSGRIISSGRDDCRGFPGHRAVWTRAPRSARTAACS